MENIPVPPENRLYNVLFTPGPLQASRNQTFTAALSSLLSPPSPMRVCLRFTWVSVSPLADISASSGFTRVWQFSHRFLGGKGPVPLKSKPTDGFRAELLFSAPWSSACPGWRELGGAPLSSAGESHLFCPPHHGPAEINGSPREAHHHFRT